MRSRARANPRRGNIVAKHPGFVAAVEMVGVSVARVGRVDVEVDPAIGVEGLVGSVGFDFSVGEGMDISACIPGDWT